MTKVTKLLLATSLIFGVAANADVEKGQKLFQKKLKQSCGFTGAKFASKHSQDEWEAIFEAGKFKDEIKKICPNAGDADMKDGYIQHYFDFSYEYANDSGNVPSC